MAENKRLCDLTRLLLSSSAFSGFLNELSGTGVTASSIQEMSQPRHQPQRQQQRKDADPNQYRSHSAHSSTIGMAAIPEEPSYNSNSGEHTGYGYNNADMNTGLHDAQVYAVTSVPEPDFMHFDSVLLSQKSSESFRVEAKDALPSIELMPLVNAKDVPAPVETCDEVDCAEIDESDPTFALYADHPASSAGPEVAPEDRIFGAIPMEKALERLELVVLPSWSEQSTDNAEVSAATLERFQRLCYSIESSVRRVASLTEHL